MNSITQRRHMPLAARLFVLFVAAAALPLGVSGIFGLSSNYLAQRRQVEALQQEIAANTANAIDAHLEQIEAEMALTTGKWTSQVDVSAPQLLQSLLTFDRGFETLALLDKTGQEVAKVSRYTLFTEQDLGSQAHSPAFWNAIEGYRYLGPVTISQFEEPLVTLAIPVRDVYQDIVGALVAEVNLKNMWDIVADVEIETGGYAYVVDSEGQLIAHQDPSQVLQNQNLSSLAGVRYAAQDKTATHWYTGLEGSKVIGSHQSLDRADWFVLVESPQWKALANVYYVGMLNLVAVIGALGLATFLSRYMARNVVRPIVRLQEGATRIGEGDLAYRIDVSSHDEIGDLAKAFNGMAAQLEETIDSLQQRLVERQQAEKALRASEATNRALLEAIPDTIYQVDHEGAFLTYFPSPEHQPRLQPDELLGQRIEDVLPTDLAQQARHYLELVLQTGKGQIYEYELVEDGEARHYEARQVSSGEDHVLAIVRDVTDRVQAQERLQESEEMLRLVFENAFDGISVYEDWPESGARKLVDCNARYTEMSGYDKQTLLDAKDTLSMQTLITHEVTIGNASMSDGEEYTYEGRFSWLRPDNKENMIEYAAVRVQMQNRWLTVGVDRDITERIRAEQELRAHRDHLEDRVQERTAELETRVAEVEQLNRAMTNVLEDLQEANARIAQTAQHLKEANAELESFSYSVSHDLRAPLRHIDGFVRLLAERLEGQLDESSARYVDIIRASVGKMSQLIEDLLLLSRTGRTEMRWQRVDLDHIVDTIQHDLAIEAEGRQIDWQITPLPTVEGDPTLLRQVWTNLLSNAVKYTAPREQARIEIGTLEPKESDTGEVTVYVRDNGVGFDPQYGHKLFGVFQRLHQADEFEGTGIGLAIVRRIIYRHGGRTWAKGRPDQGATFYITLRTADAQTENRSKQE